MTSFVRNRFYKTRGNELCIQVDAKIFFKDRNLYKLTANTGRSYASFTLGDGNHLVWSDSIRTYLADILDNMNLTMTDVGILTYESGFKAPARGYHSNGYRFFHINCSLFMTTQTLTTEHLPF